MKILATGSDGLLGNYLKSYLGNEHIYHTRKDANLLNKNEVNIFFKSNPDCDTVIHCAAKVGGVKANMNNNKIFFDENYQINKNVLEAAYKNNVKNFVSILSTCIFPDKEVTYPLSADQIENGKPHSSNYGYAYAKRLLGYETSMYRKLTGNNWISIIPCNLYGKHDQFNLENSHLIPALIHKAYLAKRDNTDFIVWGDGKPLRQFLYGADLAKAVMWALENWNKETPFMAVNENEYSVEEIALIIARVFDIDKKKIKFDTEMPSGQFRKPAESDIPSSLKFTPIEKGIETTIDWFVKNYDKARK